MVTNVQQALLAALVEATEPLVEAVGDPEALRNLFEDLGWDTSSAADFPSSELSRAIQICTDAISALAEVINEPPQSYEELLLAAGKAAALSEAIQQTQAALAGGTISQSNATDLASVLVVRYLQVCHPATFHLAQLLGILEVNRDSPPPMPNRPIDPLDLPRMRLNRIPDLLLRPVETLRTIYSDVGLESDRADAIAALIFPLLEDFFRSLGVQAVIGLDPSQNLSLNEDAKATAQRLLTVYLPAEVGRAGCSLVLHSDIDGVQLLLAPFGDLSMTLNQDAWLANLVTVVTTPGLALGSEGVVLPVGHKGGRIELQITITPINSVDTVMLGTSSSTHLQLGSTETIIYGRFSSELFDYGVSLNFSNAAFVISPGDGDGFLQRVLLKDPLPTKFDLAVGWSNRGGLYFRGSAGLEATLPVHVDLLGVLRVDSVYLAIRPDAQGITAAAATTFRVQLGPVIANVDRVGLQARFSFPQKGGNLGPAHIDFDFKPPDGAGLALDGSAITGGGYLFFDRANEQYAGILQLEVQKKLALKAIGLLTTRMPDGSKGFSLLVIISAEFPPIQLGYGFTLNGVGGLLGVNRTAVIEVLRAGVKAGTLGSILFPKDPVENAPRIISDLRSVFPPAADRYVFGPMAKLGWGTPTVLTVELGIILELPSPVRLAILGRLTMVLPDEKAAVVVLRMDILGVIDFDKGDASIDATLVDSRVATFAITGDMAMRLNWGARPTFALAAGGLHPRMAPPPGFPSLDRLAITLATGNNPRLRLEAYLALTANTVQFGARLDAFASLNVPVLGTFTASANLSFDALIPLAPFQLRADIEGAATIQRNGKVLFAATLTMGLTGPTPWRAWGEATFDFLGAKRRVKFDVTVGKHVPQPLPLPVRPIESLREALKDPRSWSAQLPAEGQMLVTLRRIEVSDGTVLAHPLGDLTVRQRVVPLHVEIARFGAAAIEGPRRFTIKEVRFDGNPVKIGDAVRDAFAPGQFFNLKEDEKLSRPAFESLPSGRTRIGTEAIKHDAARTLSAAFGYETVVIDKQEQVARPAPEYLAPNGVLAALAAHGAAALSPMHDSGSERYAGPDQGIAFKDPVYVVASVDDLTAAPGPAKAVSYVEAEAARRDMAGSQTWQVVTSHEIAGVV